MTGRVELEVVGGTDQRSRSGIREAVTDGTVPIGAGSAFGAGFAPSALATFVTDDDAGRWLFVSVAVVALVLVFVGVYLRRRMRLRSSAGVVAVVEDTEGEADRLRQDRRQAEGQLSKNCTVAVAVVGSVTAPESAEAASTVDEAARQVVQAFMLAAQVAHDAPSATLAPMMRLHMAFRFGARLGHTYPRELVLLDKRQEREPKGFFPAVRLRASDPTGSQLDVWYTTVEDADLEHAALALDLQGFSQDFFVPVRAACLQYGYRHLLVVSSRGVRLDSSLDFAYDSVVAEICHAWRNHQELPAEVHNRERGIFLSGPPSIAVALGAQLARRQEPWTPYRFVPQEGRYRPLTPPARAGS